MTSGPLLPAPLVSTQWLADHLGAEKLVIVDATVFVAPLPGGKPGYVSGHEQYIIDGHLPGAVFADLIDEFSDPSGAYPFTRPSSEAFALAAGSLGIDDDTTVVVYDAALGQWAARVWWLFRAFGYDDVAVLDGGLS
ncbi:MAG: rhodanese-like domain-containing protein, partial [Aeromicrobium sp.]